MLNDCGIDQQFMRKNLNKRDGVEQRSIKQGDVKWFYCKNLRGENGKINNMREKIIVSVLNGEIPVGYYRDRRWGELYRLVMRYMEDVCESCDVVAVLRGGRKYNYDIELLSDGKNVRVEFKYNVKNIRSLPQILQVNKLGDYIESDIGFVDTYYENYLVPFLKSENLMVPEFNVWSKEVFHTKPECMSQVRELYDNDTGFKNKLKCVSEKCIQDWIELSELNKKSLNDKLREQIGKMYMMYKDGVLYREYLYEEDLCIISTTKGKNEFIGITKNKRIRCMLRWKNRIGIGNPALQISVVDRNDGE